MYIYIYIYISISICIYIYIYIYNPSPPPRQSVRAVYECTPVIVLQRYLRFSTSQQPRSEHVLIQNNSLRFLSANNYMQTVIGELDVRVVCRERFRSSTSHTQTYTAHGTRHTAHNTHFHRLRRLRQKVVAAVVAVAVAVCCCGAGTYLVSPSFCHFAVLPANTLIACRCSYCCNDSSVVDSRVALEYICDVTPIIPWHPPW